MKRLDIQLNAGFTPPVFYSIKDIKEEYFSHQYYGTKHPGGAFTSQLNTVITDFLDLTSELNRIDREKAEDAIASSIINKYKILVYDFVNYYETGYEVRLGCCKKQQEKPVEREDLWKWLKKNGYDAGQKYYEETSDDVTFVRELCNKLKHTSSELRYLSFNTSMGIAPGYFLESSSTDGSLGPHESIHPKEDGGFTANSFNFELRRIYYCIYIVATALDNALRYHFQTVYSITLGYNSSNKENDDKLIEVYSYIMEMPPLFFPNEFNKRIPYPLHKMVDEKEHLIFRVDDRNQYWYGKGGVHLVTSGDGFTRSFKLPYL